MGTAKKQPLKLLEIPLSKINEEVIPYYQSKYDEQRVFISKLATEKNIKELQKEILLIRRAIVQLGDLVCELDNIKLQVEDSDMERFEKKAVPLYKSINNLITGYRDLSKSHHVLDNSEHNRQEVEDVKILLEESCQKLISENLEDMKLHEYNGISSKVDILHEEINDLHDIFNQLNGMIVVQGGTVQDAFESVEGTSNNVNGGLLNLQTASRLKMSTYPMTGAVLGCMLGGPIGIVAGAKIGGLASLCCSIAGYTGLKALKNSK